MLEPLLAIIDRLIELRKGRIAGRKEMFDRIIEPVFNDLLVIHGDYIEMFEGMKVFGGVWPATEIEIQERLEAAKNAIREKRREFEPVRRKVEAMASTLALQHLPHEEQDFAARVLQYLPSGEPSMPQSSATAFLQFLDTAAPETVDEMLAETIQRHRNLWSAVCSAFAKVKVAVAKER